MKITKYFSHINMAEIKIFVIVFFLELSALILLFAMIRSVVKSFKFPDVDVVAAWMSNESALTCMTDSTPKNLSQT